MRPQQHDSGETSRSEGRDRETREVWLVGVRVFLILLLGAVLAGAVGYFTFEQSLNVGLRVFGIYLIVEMVSGGIAYFGNHWGKKIGRKKMSVLGLRPKHTSILITTVTGSLIAIVTLTLAALLSQRVQGLLRGVDRLEKRYNELNQQVATVTEQLRHARIVWGVGETMELGTLFLPGSPDQVRQGILLILSAANGEALKRNSRIASEIKSTPPALDSQIVQWDEKDVDRLVSDLLTRSRPCGIRIVATKNCLLGDKVPVNVEALDAKLVFRAGQVVASRNVVPNSSKLLIQWYDFLELMKNSARAHGEMEVNDSLGGELTTADFERLVAEMGRLKGPGRLEAVANRDLYETSRLDVRIQVEALPKP